MPVNGMSDRRNVIIDTVSGTVDAMPLDAHRAIVQHVQAIEDRLYGGETIATIASGNKITVVLTGKVHNRVHVFDFYGTFSAIGGSAPDYNYEYIETVPRIEDIT